MVASALLIAQVQLGGGRVDLALPDDEVDEVRHRIERIFLSAQKAVGCGRSTISAKPYRPAGSSTVRYGWTRLEIVL